jgi:Zn-dependent M28 family amino/carboxypeptidase
MNTSSRTMPPRLLLIASLIAIPLLASADWEAAGKRWWAHVQFLASDELEGRLTGTEGYRKAADYVAKQFKDYGLVPAGTKGYFQPVRFELQHVIASKSTLTLVRDQRQPLMLGEDAILGSRLAQPKSISAPLVFVGYGLQIPDVGYDDLRGQDLKGKILVYINGGPGNIAGPLKANARAPQEFWRAVQHAGAVGVLTIPNPKSMDIPWSRMALASSQGGMRLADAALQDNNGPIFTGTLNPAHADQLFAGSGHTLPELLALADAAQPLPRFPLVGSIEAFVITEIEHVESPNVVGIFPGVDPRLQSDYVVVSAHLDHVGVGEPINGDRIYNGAMDDASGVATILEIARSLHDSHAQLKRSVLFIAVCGEEKGLLGSRYFAGHPTVPAGAMVADLNTDMFLPIVPLNNITVWGLAESTLGDDIRAVAEPMDVHVHADQQPDRNIFIRSDQYSFIRQGVPAIANGFAPRPGTPEEQQFKDWLTNRYHAPSDDVNQPVDLVAAARFNELILKLTERVADAPTRPHWKETSYFRRFAKTE